MGGSGPVLRWIHVAQVFVYLPGVLSAGYFTGGLSAVGRSADDIYAACYEQLRAKSLEYYKRFPGDRVRFAELAALAKKGEIATPSGDVVCPSRLRSLGHLLGASGGAEKLHYLLEYSHTSRAFRHDLAELLPLSLIHI